MLYKEGSCVFIVITFLDYSNCFLMHFGNAVKIFAVATKYDRAAS
jgi:hypothetical protein